MAMELSEQTVILSFTQGTVTNRRRIKQADVKNAEEVREAGVDALVQTEVDKDMLVVSKLLFDSPELKSIIRFNNKTRLEVRHRSVPSFMRSGMYMFKAVEGAVKTTDEYLSEQQARKHDLVEAFVSVLPERIKESKAKLGPAHDEADYPNPAQIRKAFTWEWRWLTMATPAKLKQISAALFEREAKKAEEALESAVKNIEALMAREVKVFVDRLIERLTPAADGKRKVFHNTLTTNIAEFVKQYPLRNIGSSQELDDVMEKMSKLLDGVDAEVLRDNDKLAEDLREAFKKVQATLEVIEAPDRILELEG